MEILSLSQNKVWKWFERFRGDAESTEAEEGG
jgi:hypothetical protein